MDCSPPSSSVHGILHARILEWVAVPFPRGSSQPRDWIHVSCIAGRFFTIWATISVWSNLILSNYGSGEDSWESLGLQGDQTRQYKKKLTLHIHWKDWCWSWSSSTLATWCKKLTHWQRSWCWERLRAGGEEGSREWDGWMASPTQWTWVLSQLRELVKDRVRGGPGVLQSMVLQRVRHNWATELNGTYKTK